MWTFYIISNSSQRFKKFLNKYINALFHSKVRNLFQINFTAVNIYSACYEVFTNIALIFSRPAKYL
jgi:hypothetical protein